MQSDSFDGSDTPLVRQRRRWFIAEMDKNRAAYTYDKQLTLFAGTWNVNGSTPEPSAEIHKWLFPVEHENDPPFDVYMLGLQEVQQLAGVDVFRTDATKGQQWQSRIRKTLGSDYEQIAERQLVGIMVVVFLRRNHTPYLSNVQLSYAATGFLNAGNKGGVAARFQLYDRTIACVACHLAAHTDYVDRRNQDFRDVVRKAVFLPVKPPEYSQQLPAVERQNGNGSDSLPRRKTMSIMERSSAPQVGLGPIANNAGPGQWFGNVASVAAAALSDMREGANTTVLNDPNAIKVLQHDVVFWLGDLNYRVDAPLQAVMQWIEERNWRELYQADQLQRQMKTCDVFAGFQEGPIRFPPTYKHHRFKDGYKCGENGEQTRVPAYTDRILWRFGDGRRGMESLGRPQLKLREYSSAQVYSSDHRPVYASFEMKFGVEDVRKRKSVEAKVNRELDQREASLRPSVQFSPSYVDFGDIFFEQQLKRSVTVRNVGDTTAFITVLLPPDPPEWFYFDESKWRCVELPPGKSLQLKFGAMVTAKNGSASDVSRDGCTLEISISISIEPGHLLEKIRVRGKYVATTLGLSLETLSMLEKPVLALRDPNTATRELQSKGSQRDIEQERTKEPGIVPFPIPKELWLLIDALIRPIDNDDPYMDTCPGIFLRHADEAATQRVLSLIDRGEKIPKDVSGYAIAQCMLDVLRNLEDSVIPRALYRRVIEAGQTEEPEHVNGVIELLPPLNANVFWYIIGFLCQSAAVRNAEDGGKEVAAAFGDVLLANTTESSPKDGRYKTAFVTGAFRIHERWREPAHRALFDLSTPASHPKRIVSDAIKR